jgi:tetratricopeptide (TPR) repeat protein
MKVLILACMFLTFLVASFFIPRTIYFNQQREYKEPSPEHPIRPQDKINLRKQILEKAIVEVNLHPESAEAHFDLAEAYMAAPASTVQNHCDDIIVAEYIKAINLKPDFAEAYNRLAGVYGQMNKYEKQFKALDKAISLKPDDAEAYCDLGFAHLWTNTAKSSSYPDFYGERKLAVKAFQKAIKIKPDYVEAFRGLGEAYYSCYSKRMNKKAIEVFQQAIHLDRKYVASYLGLGKAYIEDGNREGVMQILESLAQLGKEEAENSPLKRICQMDSEILLSGLKDW